MNRTIKISFLIIALVVPSLFYIFLRGFGVNKFEIPVFYENGLPFNDCNIQFAGPHTVGFKDYTLRGGQMFYFPQWVNDKEFYRQCERIKEKHPSLVFTAIADSSSYNNFGNILLVADEEHLFEIANCSLAIGQDSIITRPVHNQLVLVDVKNQIRGYYNGNELEEMDRLDMELDILKKEDNQ